MSLIERLGQLCQPLGERQCPHVYPVNPWITTAFSQLIDWLALLHTSLST
jgi:hypothetical protein